MSALSSSPLSLGSVPGASTGAADPFAVGGSAFGGATPYGFSIPQGSVGELDSAAGQAAGASLGFSMRASDVTSAVGTATAGWEGAAQSAFVAYAGHLRATLNSNSDVLGRAFTTLSAFARELEHAQTVTKQAAAQCEHYHGEVQTQQGLVQLHGGNAQTLYEQAAAAAHPQVQGDLVKQAHTEAGLARQASDALTKAQGEFDAWQKRGIDADTTYTTQADSATRQIHGLAGELRAPAALPGGSAPVPITVTASDMNFAKSMLPAIQAMPNSAWSDDPGTQLSALNGGQPLTPSQILAVYDEVKAQQANGKGSIIDGFGGLVSSATGGLVSFGNPNTARYHGGEIAGVIVTAGVDPEALGADGARLAADGADSSQMLVDAERQYWTKTTDFQGTRVYQRDDLIDPARVDQTGRTSAERMSQGLAPVGPDGKAIELHHTIQTSDSPLAEVTNTFHTANRNVIHINPSSIPSGIDRQAFRQLRQAYWKARGGDFAGP